MQQNQKAPMKMEKLPGEGNQGDVCRILCSTTASVQCTGKAASWKFELGRQRSTPRNYCKQLAIATQLDAHIFPWPVRSSHKLRIERDIEQSEPEKNEVYTSIMKHTKMIRKKKPVTVHGTT